MIDKLKKQWWPNHAEWPAASECSLRLDEAFALLVLSGDIDIHGIDPAGAAAMVNCSEIGRAHV